MDETTLIVSAIVAGLTAGVTETASTAVKDLYNALKTRLGQVLSGKQAAQYALNNLEQKPESDGRQLVLKEELSELEAAKDVELIRLAQKLLAEIDRAGSEAGKYQIAIQNAQGVVIGDQAKVDQHFGTQTRKRK